ncbi:MAG: hypothetical protein Q7R87_04305 [Nanoarchaeota archaeon]|nr:hypothetical protein [Nanoarchaeota archaeon]
MSLSDYFHKKLPVVSARHRAMEIGLLSGIIATPSISHSIDAILASSSKGIEIATSLTVTMAIVGYAGGAVVDAIRSYTSWEKDRKERDYFRRSVGKSLAWGVEE